MLRQLPSTVTHDARTPTPNPPAAFRIRETHGLWSVTRIGARHKHVSTPLASDSPSSERAPRWSTSPQPPQPNPIPRPYFRHMSASPSKDVHTTPHTPRSHRITNPPPPFFTPHSHLRFRRSSRKLVMITCVPESTIASRLSASQAPYTLPTGSISCGVALSLTFSPVAPRGPRGNMGE